MFRRILITSAILVAVAAIALWGTKQIPSGDDADVATAVGRAIATGYAKFEDRGQADRTHRGQIYYSKPGARGNPKIILYEVTSAEDIAAIEALAHQALSTTAGANRVTLEFYEKQNWNGDPGGGGSRGPEKLLKRVTFKKQG